MYVYMYIYLCICLRNLGLFSLELGLFSCEKRRQRGDPINVYKYLKCVRKRDMANAFSVIRGDRARGNGHKLEHRKLLTNIWKSFFTVRVTEHWNRLPKEIVDSRSPEIFKTCLEAYLCSAVGSLLCRGFGLNDLWRSLPAPTILILLFFFFFPEPNCHMY